MDTMKFLQSGAFKKILWIVGGLALAFLIFNAGVAVGFQKAGFASRTEQNYSGVFGRAGMGGPRGIFSDDFASGHGAAGKILKISLPTLTIEDRDGTEKAVLITADTSIRKFRDTLQASDLAEGEYIVAIGTPNAESQIEAHLIRILPPPPDSASSTAASNSFSK